LSNRRGEKLFQEGKPAFIICGHYGITGLFTFYLPEARAALHTFDVSRSFTALLRHGRTTVFISGPSIVTPNIAKGENAIYVTEPGTARLESGWFWKWLAGKEVWPEPTPVAARRCCCSNLIRSQSRRGGNQSATVAS